MATSMDLSYFNSGPLPYQYQNPVAEGDYHFDQYNNTHTEPFNPAFSQFQEAFYETPVQPARAPSVLQPPSISPALENGPFVSGDDSRPRSSSEDKEGSHPQQNKRKAQNRAAQRAFRERKERHLKEVEAKLANLQKQSMSLDSENERLRKELAKVATENKILRATSGGSLDDDDVFNSLGFNPKPATSSSKETDIPSRAKFSPLQMIVIDDNSGEPLLNAGQTWDYIQAHEKYKQGLIEVGDVCERLKKMARCHGQGPVFRECDIRKAIDQSAVAGGRDELI